MLRFLLFIALIAAAVLGAIWYSSQSMPDWYQPEQPHQQQVVDTLADDIKQQGVGKFLGNKFAEVMRGEMRLSETEFNALLLTSLSSSRDGRRLLKVSDAINADLQNDRIELGVVVNLEKAAQQDAKNKKRVEQLLQVLPLLDKSRIYVAVSGRPIAKNGNLAFADDISIKIGAIPISNSLLRQLGVPLDRVSNASLPLQLMSVKSIATSEDEIVLGVRPRF